MSQFETAIPLSLVPDSKSLDRLAEMPVGAPTIRFGMHGGVSEHYKYNPPEEFPSTIDYLVASVGGCLIGTFGGSLRRARVRYEPSTLTGVATGYVESDDDGVLVLRRIRVTYSVEIAEEFREAAQEVLATHASRCPNARSVSPAIEIETDLQILEPAAA